MRQSTFDDIRKVQSIEQLSAKQLSIVRLLSTGATQGMISRQLRISRASVSQTCRFLEENNLIKKEIGTRYNIIYSISAELHKRIGGSTERLSACRVHNVSLKFAVISQDHPVSTDKRTGYNKKWKMRGDVWWYAFQFYGKAGEINTTVTVYPKTIKIEMDAGQKVLGRSVKDSEDRAFQHLIHVRQQFIDSQRLFGINLEIEPTGTKIRKVHGGFAGSAQNPVMQEGVTTPGWWIDKSGKGELGEDKLELEAHTERGGPTRLDNLIKASEQFEHLPEMFKNIISPISADVTQVKAMMMGEVTMQRQYEAMMKFMTAAMTEIQTLRKEVQELKRQG